MANTLSHCTTQTISSDGKHSQPLRYIYNFFRWQTLSTTAPHRQFLQMANTLNRCTTQTISSDGKHSQPLRRGSNHLQTMRHQGHLDCKPPHLYRLSLRWVAPLFLSAFNSILFNLIQPIIPSGLPHCL